MSNSPTAPFQALHNAKVFLRPLLHQHATITSGYEAKLRELAVAIVSACAADADAALASLFLDNPLGFTVNHAVHVGVVAAIAGPQRGLLEDQVENLVAAALTMNVSIADLQDTLVKQQGPPNPLQKSSLESHAKLSNKLLGQKGVKQRDWLNAVMQHHERSDGTGPLRMRGDAIMELAQVLGLCDRYVTAMMAKSAREPGVSAALVSSTVRNAKDEEETFTEMAKSLGSHHPGQFVSLGNNEIAVVLRRGSAPGYPVVASLGARGALSLDHPQQRDTGQEPFAIVEVLDAKMAYNKIKLVRLWGYPDVVEPETAAA